ncbi:MAG: hypothetical protein LBI03_04920, partial [Clostridiales bacterium]|nr:hypothetical protein [Clostridiales bacterium]
MISAIMAESFKDHKKAEYIRFAENLGTGIRFSEDKWICDKLRRAPAEKTNIFTLYFHQIPVQYSDMVKYFSLICFIQGKAVSSIKNNITNLIRFFDFWFAKYKSMGLNMCDEFVAANFYSYLEEYGLAESTNSTIWSSVNSFFKTMREWDDTPLKNPFSVTPYHRQKKFGEKYIPESVALQLDRVFKNEDASLHLRCAYWLLRLIPSRISEIVGMRIDCLKRYNGNYVLFIPTWKQIGGWQEPI